MASIYQEWIFIFLLIKRPYIKSSLWRFGYFIHIPHQENDVAVVELIIAGRDSTSRLLEMTDSSGLKLGNLHNSTLKSIEIDSFLSYEISSNRF